MNVYIYIYIHYIYIYIYIYARLYVIAQESLWMLRTGSLTRGSAYHGDNAQYAFKFSLPPRNAWCRALPDAFVQYLIGLSCMISHCEQSFENLIVDNVCDTFDLCISKLRAGAAKAPCPLPHLPRRHFLSYLSSLCRHAWPSSYLLLSNLLWALL